jgi:GDP-L-fucose synthase
MKFSGRLSQTDGGKLTDYWSGKKILVTGGAGFLGSEVVRNLTTVRKVHPNQVIIPRSHEFDLRRWEDCERVVKGTDIVIHLAARVGGIGFNQENPGSLFYDNMLMGVNMIEAARRAKAMKFVQLGTVCAYPKYSPVPFKEDDLWNGYPEETNAPYGIAKKSLLVMAQAYRQQYAMNIIYLLPVNLYGPGDNFDLKSSHVIPALIRKFIEAKENGSDIVEIWGTGKSSREFLYVGDAAEAILLASERYDKPLPVNLGTGEEITISALTKTIADLVDYHGTVKWLTTKPDGQPRRRLDTTRAKYEFGFEATIDLEKGLKRTIDWFVENREKLKDTIVS